ncbi:MAG TPA: DoxX family protein [Kofleriaceae bacterium]|nr:DoxX family protein [Kofleriaceae bacterium]
MRRLFGSSDSQIHLGLLVLRLGIGAAFMAHGIPKLRMGPEGWTQIGQAVGQLGVHSGYQVFGLLAGLAEAVGGLLLVLGLFTRLACIPMLFTMVVAITGHISGGEGFQGAAHAIEDGVVFLTLLITGAGRYSVDAKLAGPPSWS